MKKKDLSLLADFLEDYGLKLAFWGCGALFFLGLIVSRKLEFSSEKPKGSTSQGVRTLLKDRKWVIFLAIAFVAGLAFTVSVNFFFPYNK